MKLTFFDVDGVLSVPNYKSGNEFVLGFTADEWKAYCQNHGEDTYEFCRPVQPVRRYAEKLREEEGSVLFALTASQSEPETLAKRKFISRHYPGLFEDVLTVPSQDAKVGVIQDVASRYGVDLRDCELVEDTLSTLLDIRQIGVKPTHISALVCDL